MKDQYTKRDGQHYMEMYCLSSNIYIELFIQDYFSFFNYYLLAFN